MSTLTRAGLAVIAAGALVVGVWAQGFPRSFYDDFPGMGRVWVAVDGPYNEHLVRDVGGLQLALGFAAVVALLTGSRLLARVVGAGALISGVPHLLYHATHLDPYDTTDTVTMLVALAMVVVAGFVAAVPERPAPPATRRAEGQTKGRGGRSGGVAGSTAT